MADVLTPEQRSKNMRAIKAKNTKIEILLCKELWRRGVRYRKNDSRLPGKPDIVINKYRIAIFCDGEFFHGKDWEKLEEKLKYSHNGEFWINKIKNNKLRDISVTEELEKKGYKVFRFWGNDIKKDVSACADIVCQYLENR